MSEISLTLPQDLFSQKAFRRLIAFSTLFTYLFTLIATMHFLLLERTFSHNMPTCSLEFSSEESINSQRLQRIKKTLEALPYVRQVQQISPFNMRKILLPFIDPAQEVTRYPTAMQIWVKPPLVDGLEALRTHLKTHAPQEHLLLHTLNSPQITRWQSMTYYLLLIPCVLAIVLCAVFSITHVRLFLRGYQQFFSVLVLLGAETSYLRQQLWKQVKKPLLTGSLYGFFLSALGTWAVYMLAHGFYMNWLFSLECAAYMICFLTVIGCINFFLTLFTLSWLAHRMQHAPNNIF